MWVNLHSCVSVYWYSRFYTLTHTDTLANNDSGVHLSSLSMFLILSKLVTFPLFAETQLWRQYLLPTSDTIHPEMCVCVRWWRERHSKRWTRKVCVCVYKREIQRDSRQKEKKKKHPLIHSVSQFPWWLELYLTMWRTFFSMNFFLVVFIYFFFFTPSRRAKSTNSLYEVKVRQKDEQAWRKSSGDGWWVWMLIEVNGGVKSGQSSSSLFPTSQGSVWLFKRIFMNTRAFSVCERQREILIPQTLPHVSSAISASSY